MHVEKGALDLGQLDQASVFIRVRPIRLRPIRLRLIRLRPMGPLFDLGQKKYHRDLFDLGQNPPPTLPSSVVGCKSGAPKGGGPKFRATTTPQHHTRKSKIGPIGPSRIGLSRPQKM